MSQTTIAKRFKVDNVLVDPTSCKLSDPTGTYGARRTDTQAVVVADDTVMSQGSTGAYSYTFTDPADNLTYEYYVEIVYAGETYYFQGTVSGGADQSENLYNLIPQVAPYVGGVPDPLMKQVLRKRAHDFCVKSEIWHEDLAPLTSAAHQENYSIITTYSASVRRVLNVQTRTSSVGPATFVNGSGGGNNLNDLTVTGAFAGATGCQYKIEIDAEGAPDTFKWSDNGGSTWNATGVPITGSVQTLNNGITITFEATTGHDQGDYWTFRTIVARTACGFDKVSADGGTLRLLPVFATDGEPIDVEVVLIPDEDCSGYPTWLLQRWGRVVVDGTIGALKAMSAKLWFDPNNAAFYLESYNVGVNEAKRETFDRRGPGALQVTIPEFV